MKRTIMDRASIQQKLGCFGVLYFFFFHSKGLLFCWMGRNPDGRPRTLALSCATQNTLSLSFSLSHSCIDWQLNWVTLSQTFLGICSIRPRSFTNLSILQSLCPLFLLHSSVCQSSIMSSFRSKIQFVYLSFCIQLNSSSKYLLLWWNHLH